VSNIHVFSKILKTSRKKLRRKSVFLTFSDKSGKMINKNKPLLKEYFNSVLLQ